ncbi:hypothetical protein BH10BAC5_BH10BAC5_07900 [soil metagenome]
MEKLKELHKQNFPDQRKFIHKIALMMGDIRENLTPPAEDWSHMALEAFDDGLKTPEINSPLTRITYNIIDNDISFYFGLKINTVNLSGLSGNEIFNMLSEMLQKDNVVMKRLPEYNNEIINRLDRARENFVSQLCFFDKLLKEFHSTISIGEKSALRLWPHGLDNAFIWKSGKKINGIDEELGIGVSNGDKYYDLPYAYITVSPSLPALKNIFPSRGHYHSEGFEGFILPYADLQKENSYEDQEKVTMDFFKMGFEKISAELEKIS